MIVDDGDVLTCGGATSFLNLGLYLIERFHSHGMAVRRAKMFLIDMDRPMPRPYAHLTRHTLLTDEAIGQIQHYVLFQRYVGLSPKADRAKFQEMTTYARSANYTKDRTLYEVGN